MRIAHVVARFPPDVGGMGEVVMAEVTELQKRGHEVTVFALTPKTIETEGVPCTVKRLRPIIPGGDAGWVPALFGVLKGFDVVHLHYPWYGGAEWVLLAKLLHKQKYIVTYHMQARPTSSVKKFVQMVYDVVLMPSIFNHAERVLLVDTNYFSKASGTSPLTPLLEERGTDVQGGSLSLGRGTVGEGQSRVVELPNGIDTTLFSSTDTPAEPNHLLFVGNLMPVKGLDILLHALVQIPEAKLTVVGAGYDETVYKKMTTDLGLSHRVTFVGSVPHKELPKYYHRAWATIVPSRAESFSLVTLESMACGTPVVAFKIPGIENKIENGVDGWLVDPVRSPEFGVRIGEVLHMNVEERKAIGERGSMKVQEKFCLKKHVEKLIEIYGDMLR